MGTKLHSQSVHRRGRRRDRRPNKIEKRQEIHYQKQVVERLPTEESHTIPLFFKPVDHMVPKEKLPLSKPTSLRPGEMKLLTPLTKEFHTIQLFSKPADHMAPKVKLLSSKLTSLRHGVTKLSTLPTEESHTTPPLFKPVMFTVPKEKLPSSKPTSSRHGEMRPSIPPTRESHITQLFSKPVMFTEPKAKPPSLKPTNLRHGETRLSTQLTEESHITPLSSNSATKIWLIFLMMRIQRKSSSAKTKSSQETSSSSPSRVKKREMNSSRSRISRASHLISSSCKATNQRWKPWRTTPSVSHSTSDSLMYQLSTEMSSKWKRSEWAKNEKQITLNWQVLICLSVKENYLRLSTNIY